MSFELPKGLVRVGVQRPYEVLLWAPRKYRNFTNVITADQLLDNIDRFVVLRVVVAGKPMSSERGRFSVAVRDELGRDFDIKQFGMIRFSPWINLKVGDTIHLRAKVVSLYSKIYLFNAEVVADEDVGRIRPVYAGKPGVLAAATVGEAISELIEDQDAVNDAITAIRQSFDGEEEGEVLQRANTNGSLKLLLRGLHRPESVALATWAASTTKALAVQYLHHSARKAVERPMRVQSVLRLAPDELDGLIRALPFPPTSGARSQLEAIHGIRDLLEEPYAMDAVLSADVGVGKTLTYMVPAVGVQRRGAKVAVLIPNTILGEQIADEFKAMFPDSPVALVTDATKKLEIDWDSNPILIGTTRLFTVTRKQKWVPDFLVIDEQQKLSSEQRAKLCGPDTNVLEATATPTPKTIAMIEHGGRARFEIDKQHAKKDIQTIVARSEDRAAMFEKLHQIVAGGGQAAVIYPRVSSSGENDAKSVLSAAERFEKMAPGRVAVIHGRLSSEEKIEVMRQARAGEKSIIVASSILEIGVTISNLQMLIVVNADRYGTSTLHQLRGRLARNGGEGWFYAYIPEEEVEESTLARVELLTRTNNGFELAELDMEQRGFGDLSGETEGDSGKSRTLFRGLMLMPEDLNTESD